MPTTREAKYLSGADRGKTIEFSFGNPKRHYSGKLWSVEHTGTYETRIKLHKDGRTFGATLQEDHPVTFTGTDTPTGLDLHKPVTEQEQP
ncbi:hypothetical protein [Glutamicibacter protophormiae]|uniref:hypothetical protein n=1 Tax=Glutamicibacter protophormiae TaxID=37930 RepID=UPI003A944988